MFNITWAHNKINNAMSMYKTNWIAQREGEKNHEHYSKSTCEYLEEETSLYRCYVRLERWLARLVVSCSVHFCGEYRYVFGFAGIRYTDDAHGVCESCACPPTGHHNERAVRLQHIFRPTYLNSAAYTIIHVLGPVGVARFCRQGTRVSGSNNRYRGRAKNGRVSLDGG